MHTFVLHGSDFSPITFIAYMSFSAYVRMFVYMYMFVRYYASSLAQVASSIYSRGIHLLSILICTVVAYLTFQRFRNILVNATDAPKVQDLFCLVFVFFFFLMLTFQLNAPTRRMHMYPIRVTQ